MQLFCSARRPSRHDTPPPSHITSHFVRGLSSLIYRSVYCSAGVVVSIKLSRMVIVLHPTFPHSRFVRNSAFWAEANSDLHLPPPPPSSALRHIPEASISLCRPHPLGAGRRKLLHHTLPRFSSVFRPLLFSWTRLLAPMETTRGDDHGRQGNPSARSNPSSRHPRKETSIFFACETFLQSWEMMRM